MGRRGWTRPCRRLMEVNPGRTQQCTVDFCGSTLLGAVCTLQREQPGCVLLAVYSRASARGALRVQHSTGFKLGESSGALLPAVGNLVLQSCGCRRCTKCSPQALLPHTDGWTHGHTDTQTQGLFSAFHTSPGSQLRWLCC